MNGVTTTTFKQAIGERVQVLKRHLPYHESDPVLNIAFNVLAVGTCLEDLEVLRNDEVYLDALGAQRIPSCPNTRPSRNGLDLEARIGIFESCSAGLGLGCAPRDESRPLRTSGRGLGSWTV